MMAYRLVLLATCILVLTGSSVIADDPVPVGKVVMNRDIYVSDSVRGELPRVRRGQVLPCLGETGGGYLVVCRDSANKPRAAFIPYRTEWGHATAKSSKHDETMKPNTIAVQVSMALKPGAIPLLQGNEFPVVEAGKKKYMIRFVFAGLSRDVSILAGDASFEPAPATTEPPPPPPREVTLEKEIGAAEAMQKELLEKLTEAEEKRENLGNLLQRLRFIEIDNAQLVAEVARSTEAYRELLEWTPDDDGVMNRLKGELKKLIERQAGLSARIKKAQLEAEPLQLVFAQLRVAENEAETLKVEVAKEEAVAAGLRANADNEIVKQGKDRIKVLLEEAADKNAHLTKAIVRMESGRQDVIQLIAMLKAVNEENTALEAQVKALAEELAKLRRRLAPPEPPEEPEEEPPAEAKDARRREKETALEKIRRKRELRAELEKQPVRAKKTVTETEKAPAPTAEKKPAPAVKKVRVPTPAKKPVTTTEKVPAPVAVEKPAPAVKKEAVPTPAKKVVPAVENVPEPAPVKKAATAKEEVAAPVTVKKPAAAVKKVAAPAPAKKVVPAPPKMPLPTLEKAPPPPPEPEAP
ncbi:MAG: hypothetical protein QGI24_02785 [Kiritimatiellia bacterium]|nr:hypothetical protein [Kiritimatiellia bacterium]MDP6847690.1 hypothetical protein [Kiritimatiellia bacterium]